MPRRHRAGRDADNTRVYHGATATASILLLARQTRTQQFLLDGSFVTSKDAPQDIDAVVWLADDFAGQVSEGMESAIELETMLLTRNPQEIVAAEDLGDWEEWVEFFSRTREPDGRRKNLVEVEL